MAEETEESLQLSLDEYGKQICEIEVLIQAGGDDAQLEELRQLVGDLKELKKLTEDSLLMVKKNRLLQMLAQQDGSAADMGGISSPAVSTQTVGASSCVSEDETVPGCNADVLGMKCRAPLVQSWGATQYYNAMIYSVAEPTEDNSDQVRVLFTHPTHLPIKPCPHFLEGKCRFGDDQCRLSHGHVVKVSDLEPFKEPDYSLLSAGVPCWARYEDDGLWYDATLLTPQDDGKWLVLYAAYSETAVLPVENIFPQDGGDKSDSDSDDDDEYRGELSGVARSFSRSGDGDEHDAAWHAAGAKRPLGDWERYTSGFGSKMLSKMGYILGHGLGKDLEGRVEPVKVEVLPPGRSLDMCAEMREKGQLDRMERKRKRKGQKTDKALEKEAEDESHDMFNFINDLTSKDRAVKLQEQRRKKPEQDNRKLDKKALNVKILQNQEEVKKLKKRLQGLQQSLKRNTGTSLQAQYEQKIADVLREVKQLESREQALQQQLQRNSAHKKLTVF